MSLSLLHRRLDRAPVLRRMLTGVTSDRAPGARELRPRSADHREDPPDPTPSAHERATAELRRQMYRSAEAERAHLALDLHNRPLQELAGVGYQLERASMALLRGDDAGAAAIIGAAETNLVGQLESMRLFMSELHPPALDDHGLVGALQPIRSRLIEHHPQLEVRIAGSAPLLDETIAIVLYRIVQDVLANIVRHGGQSLVEITLDQTPDRIELSVSSSRIDPSESHGAGYAVLDSVHRRLLMVDGKLTVRRGPTGAVLACRVPTP